MLDGLTYIVTEHREANKVTNTQRGGEFMNVLKTKHLHTEVSLNVPSFQQLR